MIELLSAIGTWAGFLVAVWQVTMTRTASARKFPHVISVPRWTAMWIIATLVIFTLVTVFNTYNDAYPSRNVTTFSPKLMGQLIVGQAYSNQEIPLDGHQYVHCVFKNVTFIYNGTRPVVFVDNVIDGFNMKSNSPSVNGTVNILKGMGLLSPHLVINGPASVQDPAIIPRIVQ